MKKGRFLAIFFTLFAVLLVLWTSSQASERYTDLLLGISAPLGAATHGWILERAAERTPAWVHGSARVDLSIQFDALGVGLVPLIALLGATPGIAPRRRAWLIAVGMVLCFTFHLIVVVLFPLLVYHKNAFTDVVGTFLGLTSFVGAPVIIWFALSFSAIRRWLPSFQPRPQGTPRGARPR
jgi:hypothetical protein